MNETEKEEWPMPIPAKQERFTFADCLTWDEDERIEIIGGEAFMMAAPSRIHQKISMELSRQLANPVPLLAPT